MQEKSTRTEVVSGPLSRDLVDEIPEATDYPMSLARHLNGRALIRYETGRVAAAEKIRRETIDRLEKMVGRWPEKAEYHAELGMARHNLANQLITWNEPKQLHVLKEARLHLE